MTDFDPVKWLEGLPRESSITDAEVRRMYELGMGLPKHPVIVELGVWQGRSACLLAKVAKEREGVFFGIDHFQHPGCSQAAVISRLRERGLAGSASVLKVSTEGVMWGGLKIDFLHIDADHSSPGIDRDCEKFIPLVRHNGVIAFDDYVLLPSEPQYPDVGRVARAWCDGKSWEDLGTADGMGFWRKRL